MAVSPKVYKLVFGKVVAGLRKREGMGQDEFAAIIGVSQPTLSRIERGKVLPDALVYKRIAEGVGMSVGELDEAVDKALSRARQAAQDMSGKKSNGDNVLGGILGALGVVALGGLVAFAVAALLDDLEREES